MPVKKSSIQVPASARLTRDLIVQAALDSVEAQGLDALSARKLAGRLNCEAMSLYNHVRSMDDLYDAMVETLLSSILPEKGRLRMDRGTEAYLNLAITYPNAFRLIATRTWKTPGAVALAKAFIDLFMKLGFGEEVALQRARVLGAYLNGAGLAIAAWQKDEREDASGTAALVIKDLKVGLVALIKVLKADDIDGVASENQAAT